MSVNAGNILFSVMPKFLQASWVIVVYTFFKKSPQKEVRWREVWWSWWPKSTTDNAFTEEVSQESCCFSSTVGHHILLKPLPAEQWIESKAWIIFRSNCVFTEQWYTIRFRDPRNVMHPQQIVWRPNISHLQNVRWYRNMYWGRRVKIFLCMTKM